MTFQFLKADKAQKSAVVSFLSHISTERKLTEVLVVIVDNLLKGFLANVSTCLPKRLIYKVLSLMCNLNVSICI